MVVNKKKMFNLGLFVFFFILTEATRNYCNEFIYRGKTYYYFNGMNSFGNILAALTIVFGALAIANSENRRCCVFVAIIIALLVIYEFIQILIPDSFLQIDNLLLIVTLVVFIIFITHVIIYFVKKYYIN